MCSVRRNSALPPTWLGCATSAGENDPGVLDELAGAVKDAATSAKRQMAGGPSSGAAANLMPDGGEAGGKAGDALDKPAAAQAAGCATRSGDGSSGPADSEAGNADNVIVDSQEWLAPQLKLQDQTPPEAAGGGAGGGVDTESSALPARQQ